MIDLKNLPTTPGCYLYRNSNGDIIYIGKAINLRKRVSQYFQRDDALGPKTKILVSQIASVETKTVNSEIEALVLESSLIKKYLPKYNSQLRDNKSYLYICISKSKIPIIFTAHSSSLPSKADIYGPFPDGSSVKSLLKTIRRLFPFRSIEKHPKTKCLYCHLGLCPGFDPDLKIYLKNIKKIKKILNGEFTSLLKLLNKELKLASKSEEFETASILKNQLDSLNYIVSGWHNLKNMYADINLPEDRQSQAIESLETTLKPYLKIKNIHRIECYDISQLGTKYFVGSMVVWQNDNLDPSAYRKFRIKSRDVINHVSTNIQYPDSANDQFMMKEVVYRRLQHPEWGTPDLIVVDGGKPQVSAISSITDIPLMGLAKKIETIVIKNGDEWVEINLPSKSQALLLLMKLRDEAHRFANKYRRELVSKSLAL
ncbi:MAG: GIY-YIG nuclease family protein [Candidatus Shapirobacteria bacterium]|nr:GIY-YIG nuclease family protein [Candidatus Shapirobacteria bacterium]